MANEDRHAGLKAKKGTFYLSPKPECPLIRSPAKSQDRPRFLACGFYLPHLPWYVPQEYLDRYLLDQVPLPPVKQDDLDDIGPYAERFALESKKGTFYLSPKPECPLAIFLCGESILIDQILPDSLSRQALLKLTEDVIAIRLALAA